MRKYFTILVILGCPFSSSGDPIIADPETTTTPRGCKCTSLCGATIEDGFVVRNKTKVVSKLCNPYILNLFQEDWCYTEGECGEYSLAWGYWDYCLYLSDSKPDWLALDWKVKQDLIWAEVKADATSGEYHTEQMLTEGIMTTFENQWDILPAGRVKAVHGVGAVCPFKIDIAMDSPFTGIFQGGQTNGFIRLGGATDFTSSITSGMTPGAALKILRTGASSANVVMTNSLGPIPNDNHNFFAVPVKSHIPDDMNTVTEILAQRFCQTGHCITKIGLSDMASYDQEGTFYQTPIFPFRLELEPSDLNFQETKPNSMEDFLAQFEGIPIGSTVYVMKAYVSPDDKEGKVLGNIVTTDNCVTSLYGDTKMFFKHQWIEDDIALKPEWSDAYYDGCYCNIP